VRVAGGHLGPRVADADDGPAVEEGVGEALALGPGAVDEAVHVLTAEPVVAAQVALRHSAGLLKRRAGRARPARGGVGGPWSRGVRLRRSPRHPRPPPAAAEPRQEPPLMINRRGSRRPPRATGR
jgi:hypothetical protein